MKLSGLRYRQVDVFAETPLGGNGLAVFWEADGLSRETMQALTRELRQFESIFLSRAPSQDSYRARIFTMEEELAFAGHPVLGAAAVLHEQVGKEAEVGVWTLELEEKDVEVRTERRPKGIQATMDQGTPVFESPLAPSQAEPFLKALNLQPDHCAEGFPLQVVSTGLPYLIVPSTEKGLAEARIRQPEFESLLAQVGAKFVYVLDVSCPEGRTWSNDGLVEDIATGSAAGPAGAYLCRHGQAEPDREILLHQGRFTGRPSEIAVTVEGPGASPRRVLVSGRVTFVATGVLD